MDLSPSRVVAVIAIAQFVPLVLFPWPLAVSSLVFFVILLLLSAFLGWALFRRKAWGRTLTVFVQGLNVIVRLITLFRNVYAQESGFDIPLLVTYVISAVLSLVILGYVDRSEVQLVFET